MTTEQAPQPEQIPNPFTQERADQPDIAQLLADKLAAVEEAKARGQEVPAELTNDLASWANAITSERGELIRPGKDLGGGVEIPDTYAMHYKVKWFREDNAEFNEPIDKDIALRVMAFRDAAQPAETAPAAAAETTEAKSATEQAEERAEILKGLVQKVKDGTASDTEKKELRIWFNKINVVKEEVPGKGYKKTIGYDLNLGTRDNPQMVEVRKGNPLFNTLKDVKKDIYDMKQAERAQTEEQERDARAATAAGAAATAAVAAPSSDPESAPAAPVTPPAPATPATTAPVPAPAAPTAPTAPKTPAPKKAAAALKTPLNLEHADDDDLKSLIAVDKNGHPRHAKGNGHLSGKFMSVQNAEKLEEMKDLIIGSLDERKAENDAQEAGTVATPAVPTAPTVPTPAVSPKKGRSDAEFFTDVSPRDYFIKGLEKSKDITYKKYGEPKSGRASAKEIQKRIDEMIDQYDKQGYDFDVKKGEYVARNPEKERPTLRSRAAAWLGKAATKTVVNPVREIAKQSWQYTTVRVNTTPGLKHAAGAADSAQNASIERRLRRESRAANPVQHRSATAADRRRTPAVRLDHPEILDRLKREAERQAERQRRAPAKKRG